MTRSPSLFTIAIAMSALIILFCGSFNLSRALHQDDEPTVVSPLVTPTPTRGFNRDNVRSLLLNRPPIAPPQERRL